MLALTWQLQLSGPEYVDQPGSGNFQFRVSSQETAFEEPSKREVFRVIGLRPTEAIGDPPGLFDQALGTAWSDIGGCEPPQCDGGELILRRSRRRRRSWSSCSGILSNDDEYDCERDCERWRSVVCHRPRGIGHVNNGGARDVDRAEPQENSQPPACHSQLSPETARP